MLLAGDSLTPFSNERHAVIQVAGEKEVLEHYKTHCQVALELLSFDVNDDVAYIARHRELRDSGCRSVSGRARPVSSATPVCPCVASRSARMGVASRVSKVYHMLHPSVTLTTRHPVTPPHNSVRGY